MYAYVFVQLPELYAGSVHVLMHDFQKRRMEHAPDEERQQLLESVCILSHYRK